MDLIIEDTIEFSAYPMNDKQIFYRIPFKFLNSHGERVQDAQEDIRPIFDVISEQNGKFEDDNDMSFTLKNGMKIAIASNRTDLWIKISVENSKDERIVKEMLDGIDRIMRSLERTVYKYVGTENEFYAYPSAINGWGAEVPGYIGLDAGSISINTAVVDEFGTVLETDYTYTEGDVINNVKRSLSNISKKLPKNIRILGSGVTGSGHEISRAIMNADVYETELDAHAEAALHLVPSVKVIFDIGGQDSKVMYIRDGMLDEAGMNKKCGAGTGSFLNAQASRLGIPIETFGEVSLRAKKPYRFSSMCTVFVGRDLIAEQAKGNTKDNIIAGLHRSLAMNFFSTLGINKKKIQTPIVFQGGVASNSGVKKAIEECLEEARGEKVEVIVPMFSDVMGAVGMALFAWSEANGETKFRGFDSIARIRSEFVECGGAIGVKCGSERLCDLVKLYIDDRPVDTLYACDDYYNRHHRRDEYPTDAGAFSENQKNIKMGA